MKCSPVSVPSDVVCFAAGAEQFAWVLDRHPDSVGRSDRGGHHLSLAVLSLSFGPYTVVTLLCVCGLAHRAHRATVRLGSRKLKSKMISCRLWHRAPSCASTRACNRQRISSPRAHSAARVVAPTLPPNYSAVNLLPPATPGEAQWQVPGNMRVPLRHARSSCPAGA